jgi:hypothetical protein
MKDTGPTSYRHFLLVFWKESSERPHSTGRWRFRLEDPRTGKRWGYVKMAGLNEKLAQILNDLEAHQEHPEEPNHD